MKTAEVAIEYVLAGLLALCAFVLPLLLGLDIDLKSLQGGALIGILGLAYLLGVIFDKVADAVLSPIEQYLRLKQAEKNLENTKKDGDPFPQDALEFRLRGENGRLEWIDSLRGRIRTTRGLAVLGLPATMGIAIFQSFMKDDGVAAQVSWHWWPYSLVAVNLLFMVGSIWIVKIKRFEKWFRIYRTDKLSHYRKRGRVAVQKTKMQHGICLYVLMLLASAITVGGIAALRATHFESAVIGICGAVTTLLALWTWSSITKTYISFISRGLPELTKGQHPGKCDPSSQPVPGNRA